MADDNKIFMMIDGEEECNEERALAELLLDDVLFSNGRKYVEDSFGEENRIEPETTVLFVNCNDIFMWGCADAECLPHDEIGNLYKMWEKDKTWGAAKWCCKRRNLQPQEPVIESMKKSGSWDSDMENLPKNSDAKEFLKIS